VTYSVGASTGCTVSGTTLSVTNASGNCSVTATKAADTNYIVATSAAVPVTLSKASQATLTAVVTPSSIIFGNTAALSSTGGTGTGLVTYSAGASTGCTVSGTTLSVTNASGNCSVTATKAADNNYTVVSSSAASVTLSKANQSISAITFTPTALGITGIATASATTTSGLAVGFTTTTPTICSVVGSIVTGSNLGTCTIVATLSGNNNYNAAASTLSKDIQVLPLPTLTITGPTFAPQAPTIANSSASVSFDVTYSGATTINLTPSNTSFVQLNKGNPNLPNGVTPSGTVTVTNKDATTVTVTISNFTGDGLLGITILAGSASNTAGPAPASAASATFTVDTTLPTLTLDAAVSPDGTVTSNDTLTVSGTVSDFSGVQTVTVNGGQPLTVTNGTFSTAITLQAGTNSVTTAATDGAGNVKTDSRTITYDTTAPVITITAPVAGSSTNQQTATVSGSLNKAGTVKVTVNSDNPVDATMNGQNFTAPITLTLGTNTIVVTATDTAVPVANTATVQRTVNFDNVNPVVAIADPAQDMTTTLGSYLVKGTTSDNNNGFTLTATVDGVAVTPAPQLAADGTFSIPVTFKDGKTYAVSVTATDQAGNASTVQRNIVYRTLGLADAVRALRIAVGLVTKTDADSILDVAPLVNDLPKPDGTIDISDAVTLLRKSVGQLQW
jgi:large repetitive protein